MGKVLVTCYITLVLVTIANGRPVLPLNIKDIDRAIDDVIELKTTDLVNENDGLYYTPEDFTNEERRMEALRAYMEEIEVLGDLEDNIYISNIIKILRPLVNNTILNCEGCQQKNTQEFLDGLLKLLQSMRKSISDTVESH